MLPVFVSDFYFGRGERGDDTLSHIICKYYSIADPEVQEKRAQKRVAMEEYYAKHGGGDHH